MDYFYKNIGYSLLFVSWNFAETLDIFALK